MAQKKVTKKQVVGALRKCFDPEIKANIVEIGLVYDIAIDDNNNVDLKVTMTSPMCPFTYMILAQIQEKVEAIKNIGKLRLNLIWDPMWNPGMMEKNLQFKVTKI